MFARLRPVMIPRLAATRTSYPRAYALRFLSNGQVSKPSEVQHLDFTKQGPKSYTSVEQLQEWLRTEHLNYKSIGNKLALQRPPPKLLTFESTPTITLGRRQQPPPGQAELTRLFQPVAVDLPRHTSPIKATCDVACTKSSRGGLTTYHGPGQIVCWPIIDMISPEYPRYTVSSYATHLETATQRLLSERYGIETFTTAEDPGVWVQGPNGQPLKIAALGVHHRRHITSYGIAINIDIAVKGGEENNVWGRFVPCGLEGKGVTSVEDQIGSELGSVDLSDIAAAWAAIFEDGLLDATKRTWGTSPREAGTAQPDDGIAGAATLAGTSYAHELAHQKQEQQREEDQNELFDLDGGPDDLGGGGDLF